jgi:uncharacterized protein with PIN domain
MLQHVERAMANHAQTVGVLRFLCDGMLARLCRRLRAAGYDTVIAGPSEHDGALVERAIIEDRLLLTCDRKLAERRLASGHVIVLPSNGLDETARALMDRVSINWLLDPFSRCLVDNSLLHPANPRELCRLPPRAQEIGSRDIFVCPYCDRIYWPGSHVRRMYNQLSRWQSTGAESSPSGSISGYSFDLLD